MPKPRGYPLANISAASLFNSEGELCRMHDRRVGNVQDVRRKLAQILAHRAPSQDPGEQEDSDGLSIEKVDKLDRDCRQGVVNEKAIIVLIEGGEGLSVHDQLLPYPADITYPTPKDSFIGRR
jgi:hypothetical protein